MLTKSDYLKVFYLLCCPHVPVNLNSPFLLNLISQVHWVTNSPFSSKQDYEIELGKSGEFFTQCIAVNLNSPILPNLILPLYWVKNSPILLNLISPSQRVKHSQLSFKQDYKIELGKNCEFSPNVL
jgi:hypothetical protein